MTNRKKEQGDEAIAKIQKENDGQADVEWVGCDLGDLKQVKEVFDGIAKKEDRLDILILVSSSTLLHRLRFTSLSFLIELIFISP
jgi:NAD(P)-dependent dehydrogenase (short-subunit alcohol dehydrogenase family)